ncbi:unnamed protein product, partial [Polarella glacialis]
LAALHAIAPGDVLLRVPASKCLSAGSAREALGSCAKGLSDQDAFILHLVRERDNGEKGHLWPWFQSLPTTAATTTTTTTTTTTMTEELLDSPLFWSEDDLSSLCGEAAARALALREAVDEAYQAFAKCLGAEAVDKASYTWARGILNSRQMAVDGDCLVAPGADLFNHGVHLRGAGCVSMEDNYLVVRASESIAAGEEAFISYGDRGNAELLIGWGFAVEENPADSVQLFLGLPAGSAAQELAAQEAW